MTFSSRETGFTIIEVIIVLAISSVLLSISLLGQGGIKENAQFKDSIEQLHSELERVKGEAATTVNENPGVNCSGGSGGSNPPGTNKECVVIGKAVIFSQDQSEYVVDTLIANRTESRSYSNVRRLSDINSSSSVLRVLDLQWGIEFEEVVGTTGDYAIVFTRSPQDAELVTRVMPENEVTNDSAYLNNVYRNEFQLLFQMPGTTQPREAHIIVNREKNHLQREIL